MAKLNLASYFRPYGVPVGGLRCSFVASPSLRLPREKPMGCGCGLLRYSHAVEKPEITRYNKISP
jgi:hypothetical protein